MTETYIDILEIDLKIKKKFEDEANKLPEYKNLLQELYQTKRSNLNSRILCQIDKNIKQIEDNIRMIESRDKLNFYIIESTEYLENYKKILRTPMKISFIGGNNKENNIEKRKIIDKYLDIVQKYDKTFVKTNNNKQNTKICNDCGNKKDFIIDDNIYICSVCGTQLDILLSTTSYKDIDRVNISAKYTYDRKVHFRDCINQYQGKQNCTIEPKVYEQLEDIFERHHLLIGDKKTRKEIRFSNITKEHILMFLKELGFPKHYENVILIHYNMTGKKPDDISHLEDKLLADFDLLVETYDKLFKNRVSRVNFISTQYVLYQLLLKHKHPCKKEDFVILKTMDRKSFHDSIAAELFSALHWSFTPLY